MHPAAVEVDVEAARTLHAGRRHEDESGVAHVGGEGVSAEEGVLVEGRQVRGREGVEGVGAGEGEQPAGDGKVQRVEYAGAKKIVRYNLLIRLSLSHLSSWQFSM